MPETYNFATVQFASHEARGERLNVGLAILNGERLDLRLTRSLEKVRAISHDVDIELIKSCFNQLNDIYVEYLPRSVSPEEALELAIIESAFLKGISSVFHAGNTEAYSQQISFLMERIIDVEPAPSKITPKKATPLRSALKDAFRREGVLAKRGEGISDHKVVPRYKIADGLEADFILKNGRIHVVESADFIATEGSLRRSVANVAVSALVFEQARMSFGNLGMVGRLVYRASAAIEASIQPALSAAEHQGAVLFNWENKEQRFNFLNEVFDAAHANFVKHQKSLPFHTSSLDKREIN
jgi:hypothetical protein|tara:strand:- start:129525 stop:130421 length:897 start_codon:yes stop_codon:yes gene_type:complete